MVIDLAGERFDDADRGGTVRRIVMLAEWFEVRWPSCIGLDDDT